MIKKSRQKTITTFQSEFSNINTFYKSSCVNWKGKTEDTDELYSEVIAKEILCNLKEFNKIPTVTRTETYCRKNHCNIEIDFCESNRDEENFAKRLTGLKLEKLGIILDYQIPLKDTRADKGLGKIDLISFNENTKTLFLIELKYKGNKETLLRATLESYTYYKIIGKNKLLNDCLFNNFLKDVKDIKIKPAVLVVRGCNAYDELKEVVCGKRPKLKDLALALDIKYFAMDLLINETIL